MKFTCYFLKKRRKTRMRRGIQVKTRMRRGIQVKTRMRRGIQVKTRMRKAHNSPLIIHNFC